MLFYKEFLSIIKELKIQGDSFFKNLTKNGTMKEGMKTKLFEVTTACGGR